MKAILHGGKSHGAMLHFVRDEGATWTNLSGEEYRFTQMLMVVPKVALMSHGKANPKRSLLAEWTALLLDPVIFQGPNPKSKKRPPFIHCPGNPEFHGDKYVRDCFRNSTAPKKTI